VEATASNLVAMDNGPAGPAPIAQWVTVSRPRAEDADPVAVRPGRVVGQLLAGLLAVLVVVALLASFAAQRLAEREAVNDAANTADVLAGAVVTPALTDALAAGEPAAVRAFDTVVRERVLRNGVVRVKLWGTDGRVVYADEPQLVGRTFGLTSEQRSALAEPRTRAEVSPLTASENEFEAGSRLLEVYRPVWTSTGTELLFEIYLPYEPVRDRAGQLWRGFAGVTVSSLLLVVALMTPIVWRLLHRLVSVQQQRERWLERAVDASDAERRRVAGTLHDGPVQELVASSFAASGAAAHAEAVGQGALAAELSRLAAALRGNIKVLRSMLVDIYPSSLSDAGLAAALGDLAGSTSGRGVTVRLDLPTPSSRAADADGLEVLGLDHHEERLVYRVVQECLRNAATHAAPCTVTVSLGKAAEGEEDGTVVLDVVDDGPGFDPAGLAQPARGHYGVQVLGDLATEAGASLRVASAPGRGTHWRLVLPRQRVERGSAREKGRRA
jgi:signal transduction histidine kinase